MKPRPPLILRNIPPTYYDNPQLAGCIQGVEAALWSLCFRQYSQSLTTLCAAIEKTLKNITGSNQQERFYTTLARATSKMFDDREPPASLKPDHIKEFRELRNDIEHSGHSPSYDLKASNFLLSRAWPTCADLLKHGFQFDINDALLPETRRAFSISARTLEKIGDPQGAEEFPYFMEPLVSYMRRLMRPTFLSYTLEQIQHQDTHLQWELVQEWRNSIENTNNAEWTKFACPVCSSFDGALGVEGDEDPDNKISFLCFVAFYCHDCGLSLRSHQHEPYLAEMAFQHENITADQDIRKFADDFGFNFKWKWVW